MITKRIIHNIMDKIQECLSRQTSPITIGENYVGCP